MNRDIIQRGGVIAAFVLVIVVNWLANALPLGGQTTGGISAKYDSLFTPAGYVFGIWGLIYLGLTAFAVWQALPAQRTSERLAAVRPWFIANCAANAGWLFAWHYELLLLSCIVMVAILVTLIRIYQLFDIGRADVPADERWFAHVPFSLYTGWITVATIANFSIWQVDANLDDAGLSAEIWTVIKIALAGTIAATVLFRRRDVVLLLVAAWAAAGIAVKQSAFPLVAGSAMTVTILGLLLVLTEPLTRDRQA